MRITAIVCLMLTAVSSWAGTLRANFEYGNLWEWKQVIAIGTGGRPKVVYATRLEGDDTTIDTNIHDIVWKQWNWELDRWYRLS